MATMARSGRTTVEGEVRSIQRRTEWYGDSGSRSIWTFRLTGTDEMGRQIGPIEVEMRAFSFEGSLTEGDAVRVSGRWRRGSLRAEQVENQTTGVLVRAKTYKGLRAVILAVFVLMMGGIVFFGVQSARDAEKRQEQLRRQQQQQEELQGEFPEEFCEAAESAGLEPPACSD